MKTVLFFTFFLFALYPLNAQEKSPAELKELFYDAEFFFAQEEYPDALIDYKELYANGYSDNASINYRLGICYLNIPGQKEKAIPYFQEAVKDVSKKYNETSLKQKSAPYDAFLFLGNAYRVNNKLTDAIDAYNKYKEVAGTVEDIKYADQQITACNTALKFIENPVRVKFTNLGDSVNGASSNYKGVVSGNGKTLIFMNELPFYDAVYFSKYSGLGWSSPINITPQIQSDGDQFVTSVSYDGTQLFLTREDPFNSDLYLSRFHEGQWSKSIPLQGQDINTKFWESHASLSKDGKTLFFTSNRKDGIGDMDLYKSLVNSDGSWSQPVNLGPVVNTSLNEDTPFITENDSVLFFSSQGHENMGGYDIFVSRLDVAGQWSKPENLKSPINTTDDDLFYYPWNNAEIAYISRIDEDSRGKEDIYAVQPFGARDLDMVLADFFRKTEDVYQEINTVDTKIPEVITVNPGTNETPEPAEASVVETTDPPSAKEIELEPVYFNFDNFHLTETSKTQLEKVYTFLKEYPTARVRLIGHADAKGPAEYNLVLSEKRAKTTMNHISSLGIDPGRMEVRGMGEKNFAAINTNPDGSDNPEGRRLNRRVEYEIIGSDNVPIRILMSQIPDTLKFKE